MNKKGFTLIELLVVIAIIAILAGIVIIAVNPTRQIAQARNAQRRADTLTTLNAIHQSFVDNGKFPEGINDTLKQIGTGTGAGCNIACGAETTSGCLDLTTQLVGTTGELYLSAMPSDPVKPEDPGTPQEFSGYAIKKDATNNRITVRACRAELGLTIEVTR
jgi:prepilin-type N-terminal cleavage/methylation domain-containing protein